MFNQKTKFTPLFFLILFSFVFSNCSSSSSSTKFSGTVALKDGSVGTVNITVGTNVASLFHFSFLKSAYAQSTTVTATGNCVVPGQSTINLSGTYNPTSGALNVSSGDKNTNFVGTVNTSSGNMSGNIKNSGGTVTGSFSGVKVTSSSAVATYCGTFIGGGGTGDGTGTFTVSIDASNNLSGSDQSQTDNGGTFFGTVSGSKFTACSTDQNPSPICGDIANGKVTGQFKNGDGSVGSFCGSSAYCTDVGNAPSCSPPTCTLPTSCP